MPNQQLIDYIKQRLAQGADKEEIKKTLIVSGWPAQDIDDAFNIVLEPNVQSVASNSDIPSIVAFPGALDILKNAWVVYKQRFGTFIGIAAVPAAATLLFAFFSVFFTSSMIQPGPGSEPLSFKNAFAAASVGSGNLTLLFAFIAFALALIVVSLWSQIALIYAVKGANENIGIQESYRLSWHKILSFIWISFLSGFIVIGGFLLLFVPGIIFAIWFSMAVYILINEDLRGMNALLKSKEYVKGKWGGVLWRLFFIGALSALIYIGFGIISAILFYFIDVPFKDFVKQILSGGLSLFITPLVVCYSYLIYKNLKSLKGEFVFEPKKGTKIGFAVIGVVGILLIPGILVATVLTGLNSAQLKVQDARRAADIGQIRVGLEMYKDSSIDNNYPASLSQLSPEYISEEYLKDPKTGLPYEYYVTEGGQNYQLCVTFDRGEQKCTTNQLEPIEF